VTAKAAKKVKMSHLLFCKGKVCLSSSSYMLVRGGIGRDAKPSIAVTRGSVILQMIRSPWLCCRWDHRDQLLSAPALVGKVMHSQMLPISIRSRSEGKRQFGRQP
jgi:hypothetical protein